MEAKSLHILWMYPDVLHLHGERGNAMALCHVASLLGVEAELRRVTSLREQPDLEWADLLLFNSGELKCAPKVVSALVAHKEALESYVAEGKMILTMGTSGAILAKTTKRLDGSRFTGLKLLDMNCKEREHIYGDDLWFQLPDGSQLIGNQIQVVDSKLEPGQETLGQILYGYGNDKEGGEGARKGNILFTNCLGPVLVKNPCFTAGLIADALAAKGITLDPSLPEEAIATEKASFALIEAFIQTKMKKSKMA